jgi:FtsP/CotA-like multicopper oxidase with cupredoxin domain
MVVADIVPGQRPTQTARPALGGSAVNATFPPPLLESTEASEPQFVVTFTEDEHGFYINGQKFEMDSAPMLTVDVGSLQHWRVVNATKEVHPFHIHQVHFLTYRVGEDSVKDPVWLDTVNVPYGSSVDLVMDFTDPIIRGTSLFHCHLLKHEDKGMMAKMVFH